MQEVQDVRSVRLVPAGVGNEKKMEAKRLRMTRHLTTFGRLYNRLPLVWVATNSSCLRDVKESPSAHLNENVASLAVPSVWLVGDARSVVPHRL
jgi:hypothetical protein